MVCPRCIAIVKQVFKSLDIDILSVSLGEVVCTQPITNDQRDEIKNILLEHGFELLEDKNAKQIVRIKSMIIEYVHQIDSNISSNTNFSKILSESLDADYSYLSRLFSSVEGITIEKYLVSQKIEKVKELLFYDELTLSEIAYKLDYSSVSHLSTQFKKETGMTPTEFKKHKRPGHRALDSL